MPTTSTRSAAKAAKAHAARARVTLPKVSVQVASRARSVPSARRLIRWVRAAAPGARQVTLRLVTTSEARRLNLAYRGRDYATNVLTFAYEPGRTGDIVLCPAVVAREARSQSKSIEAHYAHLAVHGALHLCGFDHERPADAVRMERTEIRLLRRLGFANPYLT